MVLDAQVDRAAPGLAFGRDDDHRRRLAAADVAALLLGREQGGEEAVLERTGGGRERVGHRLRDGVAGHHVRLGAVVLAGDVAGVVDAVPARVHGEDAVDVDHRDLADVGEWIGGQQLAERLLGVDVLAQPVERVRAVGGLDDRLRRHRADAGARPRA